MIRKKSEEIITYYYAKNDCGWDYYYKLHRFVTYLGTMKLNHYHKTYISDNMRLESSIERNWSGDEKLPDILQRYFSNELREGEKVIEIDKSKFESVYDRVLNLLNNW